MKAEIRFWQADGRVEAVPASVLQAPDGVFSLSATSPTNFEVSMVQVVIGDFVGPEVPYGVQ